MPSIALYKKPSTGRMKIYTIFICASFQVVVNIEFEFLGIKRLYQHPREMVTYYYQGRETLDRV